MKIGKQTQPHTAISTSDEKSITVRGRDLCRDLIGKTSFTAYFHLLLTGSSPSPAQAAVLDCVHGRHRRTRAGSQRGDQPHVAGLACVTGPLGMAFWAAAIWALAPIGLALS